MIAVLVTQHDFKGGHSLECRLRYRKYLKMMMEGSMSRPFSARILPPRSVAGVSLRCEIAELSRIIYGRPRAELECETNRSR